MLILDEPTAGLDPKQIIETRDLIRSLAGDHTIVLSTHILPEVAQTCQRVVIIAKGRVVAVDTPEGLTARLQGAETLYVQIDAQGAEAEPVLTAIPGVTRVAMSDHRDGVHGFEVESARGTDIRRDIARAVVTSGWGLLELRPMRLSLEEIFLQVTTDESAPPPVAAGDSAAAASRRRRARRRAVISVRNILAIAVKELRSYFASPMAYLIIGLFALLFGQFFYAYLDLFVRRSAGMGQMGGGANNINQDMIRYVLMNSAIIILFIMPMITMRTYAEEKRSGTIELLLTSPLTDLEIIFGKFLGALGLYAAMLAVTLLDIALLFFFGRPGMARHRRRLSRPGAARRVLRVTRPADFQPDQEPDRRRRGHLRGVPDAVDRQLDCRPVGSDDAGGAEPPVDHRSLRRLRARSHRHQAHRLLPEFHHVRPVPHGQVGGQRTVAGLKPTARAAEHCGQYVETNSGIARMAGSRAGVRGCGDQVSEAGVAVVHEPRARRPGLHAALHAEPVARRGALLLRP